MAKTVVVDVNEHVPGPGPTVMTGVDLDGSVAAFVRADLTAIVYSIPGSVAATPTPAVGAGIRTEIVTKTGAMVGHDIITVSKN